MKKYLSGIILLLLVSQVFSQSHDSTQPHQATVNQIVAVPGKGASDFEYFTASKDGFVIKWDLNGNGEHYQVSDVGVSKIAVSPDGRFVAVYETDGGALNRVSVWEWKSLTKVFNKKYSDTVNSIAFSAKGTYLIVGTSTVDAVEFFKTRDWVKVPNVLQSNSSIVSYIYTSDSEKTALFYSTSGTISYFNLQNGQLKLKKSLIPGLQQTVLYNNSLNFAGIKDNKLNIFNATDGKLIKEYIVYNPIMLTASSDTSLYYLEQDGRGSYTLKVIKTNEDKTLSNPEIVKTFKGPKGSEAISAGLKTADNLYLGAKDGATYKIDTSETAASNTVTPLNNSVFGKVYDISKAENDFYLLTKNALYKGSNKSGLPEKVIDTIGQTNIITYDKDYVILYSKGIQSSVAMLNVNDGTKIVLFTPKNPVQQLKLFNVPDNSYLVEVENNSSVNVYDFTKKTYKEIYSGAGVQDAVITQDKMLYVSKSVTTNPKSPLICVNLQTHETAATNVAGTVCFNLCTDGTNIYGISLQTVDGVEGTYVFSYNTQTKEAFNMLNYDETDTQAFTILDNDILYTNIGKAQVYCYNLKNKARYSLNRSCSLPKLVCQSANGKVLAVLNDNGSISWLDSGNGSINADWYYTLENGWYEF